LEKKVAKMFDTHSALTGITRAAVVDLLYRLADDALIIGHRDSEWTGLAPILEEDIAFSSMAQDEMGHALMYYQMLHELGEPDPDTQAFNRPAREFKCCALVCLPNNRDWAFSLVRKFLFDSAEDVRLAALSDSTYVPLAQLARKLRTEKKYHLMHDRVWVVKLGESNDDGRGRMQRALDFAYPYALGMFEPTESDEPLAQAGICPRERELGRQWASAVTPVLKKAGLRVDDNARPVFGGRVGRHPQALGELLESMQVVYQIDPSAKW
jgi:ring-1,2-phenylacetyl-CoA epoxidase subunit PaaC